jgi:hypothetical protein
VSIVRQAFDCGSARHCSILQRYMSLKSVAEEREAIARLKKSEAKIGGVIAGKVLQWLTNSCCRI